MMFLAGLAVVFAGLLGGKANVNAQIKRVVRDLHVEMRPLARAKLRTLTRHTAATRDVVRALHADGVIACEIVHGKTLRVVIYEGDGSLKTFTELPLSRRGLSAADLAVLRENLRSDVIALRGSDDDVPAAVPPRAAIAASRTTATRPAPTRTAPPSAAIDDEDPLGGGDTSSSEPTDVAVADDAGSDDELAGSADAPTALAAQAQGETTAGRRAPLFGVSAGVGVATRSFDPAMDAVTPYTSSPVPAIVIDAYVQPIRRLGIHLGGERTLRLTTELGDGSFAPTTIARFYGSADYAIVNGGAIALAARLGGGRRSFTIDTEDPDRSPDRAYTYVIAGLVASARLGSRLVLHASAAFEPVVSAESVMSSAESGRWALDVGAGVEVRAFRHVFVRAAASYQRFSWSYLMDGAGVASDAYPAGALSLGADY